MDKVAHYRQLIQEILSRRASSRTEVNVQTIFDTERDHYQLVNVGWRLAKHRVYGTVIHLDIIDGKIWVQWDGTDDPVAEELTANGVPKSEIVLGFHAPYKRPYTEYATG
jgi:hypothetical protein